MDQLFGSVTASDVCSTAFNAFLMQMAERAPVYAGPVYAVEEPGSYFVSATTNGAYQLQRGLDNELRILSNVCPHYQRQLRTPKSDWSEGYTGKLEGGHTTCKGHLWVFDSAGMHIGPDGSVVPKGERCTHLSSHLKPHTIGGLVFAGENLSGIRQLLEFPLAQKQGITAFVPANYRLRKIWIDNATFSPWTGMMIYEDLNHPGKGVHEGKLDSVVDMSSPEINYNEELGASIQTVPWIDSVEYGKLSPHWAAYHRLAKEAAADNLVEGDDTIGKVSWLAHYPSFFTHERYPFMVVNSWFLPVYGGGVRNVVEFYFPEEVIGFMPELADAALAAYMGGDHREPVSETPVFIEGIAQEDARLALECDVGMQRLSQVGQGHRVIGPLDPVFDKAVWNYQRYMSGLWEKFKRNA